MIKVKDTEYIYPLNQPRELEFTGEIDKAHLIIHDGCIKFVESPCRDKICIHGRPYFLLHPTELKCFPFSPL